MATSSRRTLRAKTNAVRKQRTLESRIITTAFVHVEDARHSVVGNPNRGKHHAAQFDRASATAKRDGEATQGARKARSAPLGNRGSRFGNYRTPSLPLTTARSDVAS